MSSDVGLTCQGQKVTGVLNNRFMTSAPKEKNHWSCRQQCNKDTLTAMFHSSHGLQFVENQINTAASLAVLSGRPCDINWVHCRLVLESANPSLDSCFLSSFTKCAIRHQTAVSCLHRQSAQSVTRQVFPVNPSLDKCFLSIRHQTAVSCIYWQSAQSVTRQLFLIFIGKVRNPSLESCFLSSSAKCAIRHQTVVSCFHWQSAQSVTRELFLVFIGKVRNPSLDKCFLSSLAKSERIWLRHVELQIGPKKQQ